MCRVWWLVLLVTVAMAAPAAAVVGGGPAAAPEPDAAVVFVQKHGLSARLEGIKDNRLGYYSFYGIRFLNRILYVPQTDWPRSANAQLGLPCARLTRLSPDLPDIALDQASGRH